MLGLHSFNLSNGDTPNIQCDSNSCFLPYPGHTYYSANLVKGFYFFEVWGASGGDHGSFSGIGYGGKGGYSSGYLEFYKDTVLYVYVGGQGETYLTTASTRGYGGWNGGGTSLDKPNGHGGAGGGGSTDICTNASNMSYVDYRYIRTDISYSSRILVAGGGGGAWGRFGTDPGAVRVNSNGGAGGGINGEGAGYGYTQGCTPTFCDIFNQGDSQPQSYNYVTGAHQLGSGVVGCASTSNTMMNGAKPGSFGYGGNPTNAYNNAGGGGGGGWFGGVGGTSGETIRGTAGSGGSGYVHTYSNGLSSLSIEYVLYRPLMICGNMSMPSTDGNSEIGHSGNGAARITLIRNYYENTKACEFPIQPLLSLFFSYGCIFFLSH